MQNSYSHHLKSTQALSYLSNMLFPLIASLGFFLAAATVQKDLQKLQTAAINAFHTKDYVKAKAAYEDLMQHMSLKTVGWTTFVDTHIRLCTILLALQEYEEGQKHLDALMRLNPPAQFQEAIETLSSRFLASRGDNQNAYVRLKKISNTLPLENWKAEDRLFFHALEMSLDDHYCSLKKRAKRFAKASDFKNASLMYEKILQAIEGGYFPKAAQAPWIEKQIRYLFADTQFSQEKEEQKFSFADESSCDLQKQLRLATRCYSAQMHYLKALHDLSKGFLQTALEEDLADCLFEIGYGYYQTKQNTQALYYLEKVALGKSRCSLLARIYLSHIFLDEKKPKEVERLLSCVSPCLEKEDPLSFEIAFLLASAAFEEKEYLQASHLFEKALQFKCTQRHLSEAALLKLGNCHMQLGISSSHSSFEKQSLFKKAQTQFENLLSVSTNESVPLTLAHLYLLQNEKSKVAPLLLERLPHLSLEAKTEAWLLMSQAEESYVEKKNLLCRATESSVENAALHSESWCLRALCELKEGNYKEAIAAFEKSSFLPSKASLQDLLVKAFETLEATADELCYLRACIASKTPFLQNQTLDCFNALISQYSTSSYVPLAKFSLARFLFDQGNYTQAYPLFKELSTHAEALFWAASTAEKLGEREESKAFYRSYVENYPTGPLAATAYFHLYSEEEYKKGSKEALTSLALFPSLFPKDPLCHSALYFLAAHETDTLKQIALCEKALQIPLNQQAQAPLFHKKIQALLAAVYLKKNDPEKTLAALISDVKEPCSSLEQECEWMRAQAYLKLGNAKKAQESLLSLLASFMKAGHFETPLFRQVWQELGHLAQMNDSNEVAADCFEMALIYR